MGEGDAHQGRGLGGGEVPEMTIAEIVVQILQDPAVLYLICAVICLMLILKK